MKIRSSLILAMLVCLGGTGSAGQLVGGREMGTQGGDNRPLAPQPTRSELENFAAYFHQDWELMDLDFHQGARAYIGQLPTSRRLALRRELVAFLGRHMKADATQLKSAWFDLGAGSWQAGLDVEQTLQDFVAML